MSVQFATLDMIIISVMSAHVAVCIYSYMCKGQMSRPHAACAFLGGFTVTVIKVFLEQLYT